MTQIKNKIQLTKRNIPLNKKLLNKYANVEQIFERKKL